MSTYKRGAQVWVARREDELAAANFIRDHGGRAPGLPVTKQSLTREVRDANDQEARHQEKR